MCTSNHEPATAVAACYANSPASWIATFRSITDRVELNDAEAGELNTAMAWICEELDVDQIEGSEAAA